MRSFLTRMRRSVGRLRLRLGRQRPALRTLLEPPEVYIVSYPKAGRTWLRVMLGKALCLAYGLPEAGILETPRLTQAAGLQRTEFTHAGWELRNAPRGRPVPKSSRIRRYRRKKVVLLVREVKDLLVSTYFWTAYRPPPRADRFGGTLSDYVRSEYGPRRIVDFYNLWYRNRHVPRDFLLIRYEDLHSEPETVLRLVLGFIGAKPVDDGLVREAVEFARFENMRAMEAANLFDDRRLRSTNAGDEKTYKTRKGVVGGYSEYLTDEDIDFVDRTVAEIGCPILEPDAGPVQGVTVYAPPDTS